MVVQRLVGESLDPGSEAVPVDVGPVDAAVRRLWVVLDRELDLRATSSLVSMAASRRAVSIPADTPAPVSIGRPRPALRHVGGPRRSRKRW